MAQLVIMLAVKPSELTSISSPHVVEGTNPANYALTSKC